MARHQESNAILTPRQRSAIRRALIKEGEKTRGMSDEELVSAGEQRGILDSAGEPDIPTPTPEPQTPAEADQESEAPQPEEKPKRKRRKPKQEQQEQQPTPPKPSNDKEDKIRELMDLLGDNDLDEDRVREIAREEIADADIDADKLAEQILAKLEVPRDLVITLPEGAEKKVEKPHKDFETLLKMMAAKVNTYIVGPAGSGKTTAAQQAAEALDIPYYFSGAVSSEFSLVGFIDAQGVYQKTPFYDAFTKGGVFCLDEIDGSDPAAILRLNAMLSGDFGDFPNGVQQKHKDFYCVATANTFGTGANRQYVGRNQMDAAALDRFAMLEFQYDEAMEAKLSGNPAWHKVVKRYRANADKHGLRVVISPRATINGALLLASGIDQNLVEEMVIFKGLDNNHRQQIRG